MAGRRVAGRIDGGEAKVNATDSATAGSEPVPAHRWLLVGLFVAVLAALVALGVLAEDIWTREGFPWDNAILQFLHRHASPGADTAMLFFTRVGDPLPMAGFVAALLLVLLLRRRWHRAAFLAVAVGGAMALNAAAAKLFGLEPDAVDYIRIAGEMGVGRKDLENLAIRRIVL